MIKLIKTLKEIKKCLDCNLVYSALVLSLSIPDIAGKLEWTNMTGNKQCKLRYCQWFNKYVDPVLNPKFSEFSNDAPKFDCIACYALRCSVLHNADTNIGSKIKVDNFIIDTEQKDIKGVLFSSGTKMIMENKEWKLSPFLYIRAIVLIDSIVTGAEMFLIENKVTKIYNEVHK